MSQKYLSSNCVPGLVVDLRLHNLEWNISNSLRIITSETTALELVLHDMHNFSEQLGQNSDVVGTNAGMLS